MVVTFYQCQDKKSTFGNKLCPESTFTVFTAALWCLLTALLLLLPSLQSGARADDGGASSSAVTLDRQEPQSPLFWADGITQIDQLADYKAAGFNTVVVRLFWQPTEDGSIVASDLEPQRAFANAAAQLQLQVIYSLPPAPYSQENEFAYSGEAGPYRAMWADWVQRAIAQLRDTPRLIGWMLPDDPRGLPFTHQRSFTRWLTANYGNIRVLNSQWNSGFQSLDSIELEDVRGLIQLWHGPVLPRGPMTDQQGRDYIRQAQQRRPRDNFAFHPAALALAHYQWDAYRGLLDFWAKTVREADPKRSVFSGILPDYAQLLSLPSSIDFSVPFASPAFLEPDLASHNPQAVNMARRGGRFRAVAMLSTELEEVSPHNIARLLPSWMDAALAQGADGFAFDSWPAIHQKRVLHHAISSSIKRLQTSEYALLWKESPLATTAIILTPLADGATIYTGDNRAHTNNDHHHNNNDEAATGPQARGVYGFGEEMILGEPSTLMYALRWGTSFGNVDILTPDELGGIHSAAHAGVLKKYGTVLLPQALSIAPAMAQELASYAASGGVIVADLGAGAAQNGGSVLGIQPELTAMFGVVPTSLQTVSFNLKAGQPHPLLPTWAAQIAARAEVLTAGSGPDRAAFAGPVTFGELLPGTVPLALAFDLTQRLPGEDLEDPSDDIIRINRSWLTLRPFGQGSIIFAPFRLWSFWQPGDRGFNAFHGDLFARASQLSLMGVPSLTPAPAGTPLGEVLSCQVVNLPNGIALLNHKASPNPPYRGGFDEDEDEDKNGNEANQKKNDGVSLSSATRNAPLLSPHIRSLAQQIPDDTNSSPPSIELTPEEFEALFGSSANTEENPEAETEFGGVLPEIFSAPTTPGNRFESTPESTPDADPSFAPPAAPAPRNPSLPAAVHTSGTEYFLWRNALCVFPVGAVPHTTPGRQPPLPTDNDEFVIGSIIRPTFSHPVLLYATIPGREMQLLQPIPIRVQHEQGGPLAAHVAEYTKKKLTLRVWPNADSAFWNRGEWRLPANKEGTVRVTLFDGGDQDGYRIAPRSKHRVTVSEFDIKEKGGVLSKNTHRLTANSQGRLSFELTGSSISVEVQPEK